MKNIALVILILSLIYSCEKGHRTDCLKSYGEQVKINRNIEAFGTINIRTHVDLTLIEDSTNWIEVISGENLVDGIITEVTNGALNIYDANKCHWMRSYDNKNEVIVHYKQFHHIYFESTGNIKFSNAFTFDSLTIDCWNAGGSLEVKLNNKECHFNIHTLTSDITASGQTDNLYCYQGGNGFIYATDVETTNCFVSNFGIGDFYVKASNKLVIQLSNVGNVYYGGSPNEVVIINKEVSTGLAIALD